MKTDFKQIASSSRKKIILAALLCVALASIAAAIYLFATQNHRLQQEFATQIETIRLQDEIDNTKFHLKEAEAGVRGYAVTGDRSFIENVETANISIRNLYQNSTVSRYRQNNRAFDLSFLQLSSLVKRRIDFNTQVIALCDSNQHQSARALIATKKGLKLSDSIGKINTQMMMVLQKQLHASQTGFILADRSNNSLAYLGISASMLLVTIVILLLVTEIKRTRKITEELQERKDVFKMTFNSIQEGLICTDEIGKVSYMNPSAEELTGWPWHEAKNQPLQKVFNVVNEKTGDLFENIVSQIIKDRKKYDWANNTLLQARQGGKFVISSTGAPITDADGNISGVVLVFSDITERKKGEKQLLESERQYKELIQNLPEAVYTCAENGFIKLYNKAAVALWGREPVIGKDMWCATWKIKNPDGTNLPIDKSPMAITVKEARAVHGTEIIFEQPNGNERHALTYSSPLFNADGQLTGSVNMLFDVTDEIEREILVRKSEEKYYALIDQAADAIFINDENMNILEVNNSAASMLGFTKEQLITMKVDDLYEEEELLVRPIMQKELMSGLNTHIERNMRHRSGRQIPVEITAKKLSDGRILAIVRDITARLQATQSIRENEHKLELIFNNTKDVIFLLTVGEEGYRFNAVNQSFYNNTGLQKDEVLGKLVAEVIPEPSLSIGLQNYATAIARKENVQWEETNEYPGGKKTGIVSITPIFNNEGNCTMLVGSVHDITARENAKREKEMLASILENTTDFVGISSVDLKMLYANQAALRALQIEDSEAAHLKISDFVPGSVRESFLNYTIPQILNEGKWEGETAWLAKDGGQIPVLQIIMLHKNKEGQPLYFSLIAHDITERKKAEEKISKAIERYDILWQATSDTVWDWDITNNSIVYNDGIKKTFGYQATGLTNVDSWWQQNVHVDDLPGVRELLSDAFEEKLTTLEMEYRFRNANGLYKYVFDRAYIIYDTSGIATRMIGAMQDVTYRKEEELRISKAVIDAQEAERRHIGAELHDNVNQILATSSLYLGIAKDEQADPKEVYRLIAESQAFINNAIQEVRTLSHELAPAIFDGSNLQEDFENLLSTFNADQRFAIQLQFDLQGQTPAADVQVNLYRILQEQIKNISKYSEATEIKISVMATDRLVSMRIADNGIGFDVKHLRKGIGLSNIKRRTEALNGKFILNSSPGDGCEIIVEIPLH